MLVIGAADKGVSVDDLIRDLIRGCPQCSLDAWVGRLLAKQRVLDDSIRGCGR